MSLMVIIQKPQDSQMVFDMSLVTRENKGKNFNAQIDPRFLNI